MRDGSGGHGRLPGKQIARKHDEIAHDGDAGVFCPATRCPFRDGTDRLARSPRHPLVTRPSAATREPPWTPGASLAKLPRGAIARPVGVQLEL